MTFLDRISSNPSNTAPNTALDVATNSVVNVGDVPVWNGTKWVASSVATPAARPTHFKPFVLRCPDCSAPTEEGQTRCRYCNVPLAWEPIESLSRDDRFYREREREREPELEADETDVVPLGFGPELMLCNSTKTLQIQAEIILRPTHLFIPPNLADHFSVEDLRIGAYSCLYSKNLLPGSAFSSGRGMPISCDTATPGLFITLKICNKTTVNRMFEALLRCKKLPDHPHHPRPTPRPGPYSGYPSIVNLK